MVTEVELRIKYKTLHDELSKRYYQRHKLSKEDFDTQHGKIWNDMEAELIAEGFMEPQPELTPPLCTHWAVIDSINLGEEKPIKIRRNWQDREYSLDCYVTEVIKGQYLAGDIAIGDYVLVEFLDDSPDRAVVFAKYSKEISDEPTTR